MDKKYIARQYALTVRNVQKGFVNPIGVSVSLSSEQSEVLSDVVDTDEFCESLRRYGFEWDHDGQFTSFKGREFLGEFKIPISVIILNIPDKRVREYLCTMFQNTLQ